MDIPGLAYAEKNPLVAGVAAFGIGFVVLYFLGFFSPKAAASTDAGGASAYYSAVTADAVSGNQLQMATVNATAATDIAQITADTSITNNHTWADTQLAEQNGSNAVQLTLAPLAAKTSIFQNIITNLGGIASKPGTTTTKNNNGFFGIGGGSSTSYTPDPAATIAAAQLDQLSHSFISAQ
jgi:hypothetical protein